MPSGKILYFVRPEENRPRSDDSFQRHHDHLRTMEDDAIARQHFYDLLRGVWPASARRLS